MKDANTKMLEMILPTVAHSRIHRGQTCMNILKHLWHILTFYHIQQSWDTEKKGALSLTSKHTFSVIFSHISLLEARLMMLIFLVYLSEPEASAKICVYVFILMRVFIQIYFWILFTRYEELHMNLSIQTWDQNFSAAASKPFQESQVQFKRSLKIS